MFILLKKINFKKKKNKLPTERKVLRVKGNSDNKIRKLKKLIKIEKLKKNKNELQKYKDEEKSY